MSGIALAILGISLISGAIFALFWARKNKRNMKAAYPGENNMADASFHDCSEVSIITTLIH